MRGAMTTTPTLIAAGLRAHGFIGRLVEPGDPDYDAARAGWNGAIDRRPAAVAYATDADDVAAAIRAARAAGLPFTIRAGGALRVRALGARRRAVHRPAGAERGRGRPGAARSCASAAARCWASSTPPRRSTGSPCPRGRSRTPASAGSRSAAASAG